MTGRRQEVTYTRSFNRRNHQFVCLVSKLRLDKINQWQRKWWIAMCEMGYFHSKMDVHQKQMLQIVCGFGSKHPLNFPCSRACKYCCRLTCSQSNLFSFIFTIYYLFIFYFVPCCNCKTYSKVPLPSTLVSHSQHWCVSGGPTRIRLWSGDFVQKLQNLSGSWKCKAKVVLCKIGITALPE